MATILGVFEGYTVKNNKLRSAFFVWNLTGATATFDVGAAKKGVTAGRVVALGIFALAVKKDKTKIYITVDLADGQQVIIDGPASKERQARAFVGTINQASRLLIT